MLKVRKDFLATDEQGNEVLIMKGDEVNEISDAGPRVEATWSQYTGYDHERAGQNVIFRVTSQSKQWKEFVTYDAVKLLKSLE